MSGLFYSYGIERFKVQNWKKHLMDLKVHALTKEFGSKKLDLRVYNCLANRG